MALFGSLGPGIANTNIGFTPANAAGQFFTSEIGALSFIGNSAVTGTITPAAQYTSTLPVGLSIFSIGGLTTDNVFRTFFTGFLDFQGFIFLNFGDQPVKDSAIYQASMPAPAYGVYNLSQISYVDNGWPSGTFGVQYTASGQQWNLQIRHSSYYASNLTASGRIAFLRLA